MEHQAQNESLAFGVGFGRRQGKQKEALSRAKLTQVEVDKILSQLANDIEE